MGEAKMNLLNTCQTVALRYRFLYENVGGGEPQLIFEPHPLIELEVDIPKPTEQPEAELKPEDVDYNVDVEYLRSLDPKDWKSQDHYKVLGIETLRFKASEDIIKTAYRKIVLKHHPDKRKALGEEIKPDDDYFTNITMAYETLGTLARRRAFDSVDPEFDNDIPTSSELKKDFYDVFNYYFNLNSRWSERPKVPKLGNENSSRDDVEKFYSFWYDFKSWREFSYEDEEDKDKCQDRDERRYVDKLNKAERLRKKKEEMSRIRTLVDLAYNNDPRIAKFRQDDKDRKLAARRAKQTAAQQKKDEEDRILKEIKLAKEQAEAAERARIEAKRQEREVMKKALKKERKLFRDTCKANSYFTDDCDKNLYHITTIEAICERLTLEALEDLNKNIKSNGKSAFLKAIEDHEKHLQREKQEVLNAAKQTNNKDKNTAVIKIAPEWNEENLQLLVKSVNLFPAGTNQRWEVIANFINQHGVFKKDSSKFTAKLVLAKAKDLQKTDFSKNNLKEQANKNAFDNFKKDKKAVLSVAEEEISKKLEEVNINGMNNGHRENSVQANVVEPKPVREKEVKEETIAKTEKCVRFDTLPWTTSEQQLLEQALKTYSASTPERWDRIAECLPNRSKKDCMKRYKELVETVKAKKAAKAAVVLITDGSTGVGSMSLKESLATMNQRSNTIPRPFPLPFPFPVKLHIVCIAGANEANVVKSKPLFQKLIDVSGSEGSIQIPENLQHEANVTTLFQKLADDMYTSFRGILKCGNLASRIILSPAPIGYTHVTDFSVRPYHISDVLDVYGFVPVADIGSPMAISRHLILPTNSSRTSVANPNEADITDDNSADETTTPSFCVLLHGALKVENMAALVTVGLNWFGFIYSWADSKKKSNLMITILPPGSDVIPWLGDLNDLGTADMFSPDQVGSFPIRPSEKRSYSQNGVVWIRQAGLQSDIQKILRHARKLPDKTQQFYKASIVKSAQLCNFREF
ncbi:hypothetical protein HUJ04_005222 [Dendroctonus ponderosae]|nr:hypothetical protein HUJ04_005222 [Dendroctonus ponderosae]